MQLQYADAVTRPISCGCCEWVLDRVHTASIAFLSVWEIDFPIMFRSGRHGLDGPMTTHSVHTFLQRFRRQVQALVVLQMAQQPSSKHHCYYLQILKNSSLINIRPIENPQWRSQLRVEAALHRWIKKKISFHTPYDCNMPPFDENDKRYRCCCGSFHVVTGAKICLGVYAAMTLLPPVAMSIAMMFSSHSISAAIPHVLVSTLLPLIIIICTIKAFKDESSKFLWPIIIALIVSIVTGLMVIPFFVISFFKQDDMEPHYHHHYHNNDWLTTTLTVAALFGLVCLCLWHVRVFIRCKHYYQAKQISTTLAQTAAPLQHKSYFIPTQLTHADYLRSPPPPYENVNEKSTN